MKYQGDYIVVSVMLYQCNVIWLGMCVYPAAFADSINRQGVQYQSLLRTTMYSASDTLYILLVGGASW